MLAATARVAARSLARHVARHGGAISVSIPHGYSHVPLPTMSPPLVSARSFATGNVEYPKIDGTVTEVATKLTTIGATLSIATAVLYFTRKKVDFVTCNIKTSEELSLAQQTLLLCDHKLAYPSKIAVGTFISTCIKMDAADVAMGFLREARHMHRYMDIKPFVRMCEHFESKQDDASIEEVIRIQQQQRVVTTTKMYVFQVAHAKKQGKWEEAVAIAKKAANEFQINSYLILTLLDGMSPEEKQQQIKLVKYLVSKGEVFVNDRLNAVLDPTRYPDVVKKVASSEEKSNEEPQIEEKDPSESTSEETMADDSSNEQDQEDKSNESKTDADRVDSEAKDTVDVQGKPDETP